MRVRKRLRTSGPVHSLQKEQLAPTFSPQENFTEKLPVVLPFVVMFSYELLNLGKVVVTRDRLFFSLQRCGTVPGMTCCDIY